MLCGRSCDVDAWLTLDNVGTKHFVSTDIRLEEPLLTILFKRCNESMNALLKEETGSAWIIRKESRGIYT